MRAGRKQTNPGRNGRSDPMADGTAGPRPPSGQAGSRRLRSWLSDWAVVAVVAALSLWSADILVRLRLGHWILRPEDFYSSASRFLGLLANDIQLAIPMSLLAVALGALVGFRRFGLGVRAEAIIILAALTSALTVRFRMFYPRGCPAEDVAVASIATGLGVWVLLRLLWKRQGPRARRWHFTLAVGLFPPLLVGTGTQLLLPYLWHGALHKIDLFFLGLFLGMAVVALGAVRWARLRPLAALASLTPVILSLVLPVVSVRQAERYGLDPAGAGSAHRPDRPSIVLIVLDTLRADHLGIYGYDRNTMPALEAWARDALAADRAVSPGGWTASAHASIFSGLTVSRHGVHYSDQEGRFFTSAVDGIAWLPARLADEGYTCIAVSANEFALPEPHMGFHRVYRPDCAPFEHTFGALGDQLLPPLQRLSEAMRWRMPYVDASGIAAITERAVAPSSGPLFLFINFLDPHAPYNPPASALAELGLDPPHPFGRYVKARPLTVQWQDLPAEKETALADLYDGEVRWLDTHLGPLLQTLESRLGHDCLTIITSDHGEELGELGRIGHECGLDQRIVHVPLFIRGSGFEAGRVRDIVTTRRLFDLIWARARGVSFGVDSLVYRDAFDTITERYPTRRELSPGNPDYGRSWVAVFGERYKALGPSAFGSKIYDMLAADFRDTPAAADTSLAPQLRRFIDRYWEQHRDGRFLTDEDGQLSDRDLERLRSLGYIQ